MKISIGAFDAEARTVAVVFEQGEVRHERAVSACLDATGAYDATATASRAEQVARGVEHKIALGVISATNVTDDKNNQRD